MKGGGNPSKGATESAKESSKTSYSELDPYDWAEDDVDWEAENESDKTQSVSWKLALSGRMNGASEEVGEEEAVTSVLWDWSENEESDEEMLEEEESV